MGPSSNWHSLQKKLPTTPHRKRQKLTHPEPTTVRSASASTSEPPLLSTSSSTLHNASVSASLLSETTIINGESLGSLRAMIYAPTPHADTLPAKDRLPGTFLAIDCEMVGVGIEGSESSLARVSVVNFFGAVVLDAFVRQKERVTDWRTRFSGVREADMVNAKSFEEAQTIVAGLFTDRVIVGHAVHNDLQALMLSHSRAQTRDTQHLAYKNGQSRSSRPALRHLVREMLGIAIQEGEHSSVIDARATMAIYRLHRKQWERAYNTVPVRVKYRASSVETNSAAKRKRKPEEDRDGDTVITKAVVTHKSGAVQRKGMSSGLSTVIVQHGKTRQTYRTVGGKGRREEHDGSGGKKWWEALGSRGSKGVEKLTLSR